MTGWDGAGGYDRVHSFSADASASVNIIASRMDAELDEFASAITNTITRDGQNEPSGNLPMGGNRHTNVGAAASATDYFRASDYITGIPIFVDAPVAGTGTIAVSVDFFVACSANSPPPDGTRLRVRTTAPLASISCDLHLYTPANTSAAASPFVAPVYSRKMRKFDPGAIQAKHVHDLIYNASVSAWCLLNPFQGYGKAYGALPKVYNAAGSVVGVAAASTVLTLARQGDGLFARYDTASISVSASGNLIVFSAQGMSAMTSGINSQVPIPILIDDTFVHHYAVGIAPGGNHDKQLKIQPIAVGTSISADDNVKILGGGYFFTDP